MPDTLHADQDASTATDTPPAGAYFDVLIVGAGLSGIGAAWHLQRGCPGTTYAILEARAAMGGTWDLFRYPGVRSDSDMYTLGYRFRPWLDGRAIADGPSIRRYIAQTAVDAGRYNSVKAKIVVEVVAHLWAIVRSDRACYVASSLNVVVSA